MDLAFKALGPTFMRASAEWPEWVLCAPTMLRDFVTKYPKFCRWRGPDLLEFNATNGRAIYRLKKYDPRKVVWVMKLEYEEGW